MTGNRQRRYWRRIAQTLRVILGERCAVCGEREGLQFDCIMPQGDRHHRYETNRRISFYRQQWRAGNLQLLCESCHAEKSAGEQYWLWNQTPAMAAEAVPF